MERRSDWRVLCSALVISSRKILEFGSHGAMRVTTSLAAMGRLQT